MKRNVISCWPVAAALCLLLSLASCSKDSKADLSDLLSTVPAEADMVVAVDVKSTLDKAGAKVSGGKIELTGQLKDALAKADARSRESIEAVLQGDAGVRPTSLVAFAKGYHVWVTGILDDPSKFREYVGRSEPSLKWQEESGVSYAGRYAVSGDQFWCYDKPGVDPLEVKSFIGLGDKKSFLSTDYAEKMTEGDYQMRGIVSTSSRMVGGDSFVKQAQMQMALQTFFSDAAYIGFTLEMDNEECQVRGQMLTSSFKPAPYNLPVARIDSKTISSLNASGDMAFAVGTNSKLVEKIQGMLSQTGAVGKLYNTIIAPIDGTVAAFVSQPDGAERQISAVIPTDGSNLSPLTMALEGSDMKWCREGNNLIAGTPQAPSGGITSAIFAKEAGGSLLAYMADSKGLSLPAGKNPLPVKSLAVSLDSEGNSVVLKIEVKASDKKSSLPAAILLSILGDAL